MLFRRWFIFAQLLDVLFLLDVITQIILLYVMVKNLPAMQETWVRSLGWENSLEEEMATHSSILAWRIPWTDRGAWQAAVHGVAKSWMHWRRKWQPTPVFLPGESQGQGSLMGCCLWGHTESDTTEAT